MPLPALRILLVVAVALASAWPAGAVDCRNDSATNVGNVFLCGEVFSRTTCLGETGSSASSHGTTFLNDFGGVADVSSTGANGLAGSGVAAAAWSGLDATASADLGGWSEAVLSSGEECRVVSTATAAYGDRLTIGSATLPAGTSARLVFTMDVGGAFGGAAGGSARLQLYQPGFLLEKNALLFPAATAPSVVPPPFPVDVAVGSVLAFKLWITSEAGASNYLTIRSGGGADMSGNRVLVDVETPGVFLASESGHDYTVPEPDSPARTASAALAVLAGASLRKRRRAASVGGRPSGRPRGIEG
jgi:hypothetical protein